VVNKKSLEALIYSGAMDKFGERKKLIENIENMARYSKSFEKKKESSQIGLFDMAQSSYKETLELEDKRPFSYEEKLF
jgi:DNA polymerase III alpha subunit